MSDTAAGQIRFPFAEPPAPGTVVEVAPGIFWARIPMKGALDHVNVYALDDGDSWTIIDTGFDTRHARAEWDALLAGPLGFRPVRRVVITHYHPDHIGLAGWFQDQGAELVTTRTSWLLARMLLLDIEEQHNPATLAYWRAAGMAAEVYAERAAERPYNFADMVAPLPLGFTRIREGDTIRMGGRDWLVRIGDGHAPEHATFWEIDGRLVIGGDQLLPGISANIAVYASEPEADPLGEWLESCARLQRFARTDQLVLPGHKLPFTGLPMRLNMMIENHEQALGRLLDHLDTPRTAGQCFIPIFGREITGAVYGFALVEAMAHLNYLHQRGRLTRHTDAEGVWWWQRNATTTTA